MTTEPKTQTKQNKKHPEFMLPECAFTIATLTEQMANITKSQEGFLATQTKLIEKIKGNGNVGIEDLVSDNQRSIRTLTSLVNTLVESKEEDVKLLKEEKKQRENEMKLTANRLQEADDTRKVELLKANEARRLEARKFIYGIISAILIVVASGAWGIYQTYATQKMLLSLAGQ